MTQPEEKLSPVEKWLIAGMIFFTVTTISLFVLAIIVYFR